MIRIAIALFLVFVGPAAWAQAAPASSAQRLDGRWEGVFANGGMSLHLAFTVRDTPQGPTAVVDIENAKTSDIPVASVSRSGGQVKFDVPRIGGSFDGEFEDPDTLSGQWNQIGSARPLPLILRRQR